MVINKGQINERPFTVSEQTTLSNPVKYLFEFKRKASNILYYCIGASTSEYANRYDLFSIEDKASPNPLNCEVDLPVGEYTYKIYQQNSTTNLLPDNTTVAASGYAWVESGVCKVLGTVTPPNEYAAAPLTNPVYEQQ